MNIRTRITTAVVAGVASLGLALGLAAPANAAYPPEAGITISGSASVGSGDTLIYRVKGTESGKYRNESVTVTVDGKSKAADFNKNGVAYVKFGAGIKQAGRYTVFATSTWGATAQKFTKVGKRAGFSKLDAFELNNGNIRVKVVTAKGAKVSVTLEGVTKTKIAKKGRLTVSFADPGSGTFDVTASIVETRRYFGGSSMTTVDAS